MPKRKTFRRKHVTPGKKDNTFGVLSKIKLEESYSSLIIGVVVVILVIIGAVFFIKLGRKTQTSSVQFKPTIETVLQKSGTKPETGKENKRLPQAYVVKQGENLWTISEKFYNSGYNWVDIAKANNLTNPDIINSGNKLVIPNVTPKIIAEKPVAKPTISNAISGSTYKVVKGDYLWEIAVRAYGDGFAWVKIAKANNLTNPDLIFSGNVLKIPR